MNRIRVLFPLLVLLLLPAGPGAAKSTRGQGQFPQLLESARKRVEVTTVVEIGGTPVVLLTEPKSTRVVPIFIGPSEAMAIALRLDGRTFQRPLTHDLLDSVMEHLGGSIVSVEVSSLEAQVFIAVLTLRKPDGTTVRLDARPSDSIALALGAKAPIYVADKVLDEAGLDASEPPPAPKAPRTTP